MKEKGQVKGLNLVLHMLLFPCQFPFLLIKKSICYYNQCSWPQLVASSLLIICICTFSSLLGQSHIGDDRKMKNQWEKRTRPGCR